MSSTFENFKTENTKMSTQKSEKIIKTYEQAIEQNYKEIFPISYNDNRILLMCQLLTKQSEHVQLFLNKDDFDKMYPYLSCFSEYFPEKIKGLSLIVTRDVLANEKLTQAMPFKTDEHFNETHPLISALPYAENIRILDWGQDERIPSFILFDEQYLVQIPDDNRFLCCLNPYASTSKYKRLNLLQENFEIITEESVPFSPQLVESYHLNLMDLVKQNNHING